MSTAGTTLGAHRILAALRVSESGEACRAQDSSTGREVSIQILPPEIATDPERPRRIEQAGRAVGSLDHPNLVRVHDLGRADLFALGCVLYEMLAGKRAFAAGTAIETTHAILNTEPRSLAESHPNLQPGGGAIVAHCLEKDPAER
jgi:serine/threonine protein kinase